MDILFVAPNAQKIVAGCWVPILVAALLYVLMVARYEVRRTLSWVIAKEQTPGGEIHCDVREETADACPGTAVYFMSEAPVAASR